MAFFKEDQIEVLFDEKALQARIQELGQLITDDYSDGRPLVWLAC